MALGFDYPPIPTPFNEEGKLRARHLLEEHVYGPVPQPESVSFSDWSDLVGGAKVAGSPFPLLWSPVANSRATIVALSFTPIATLLELDQVWPLRRINDAGLSLAVACYNDIEPDDKALSSGQAISRWAQALMQIRLWLAPRSNNVYTLGHSRLGKTALLASAMDEGFAGAIAIQSGCGGAAPSRTAAGETIGDITRVFPHWFLPRFASYEGNENKLPLDQHWLLALCASRPVLLCNAEDDEWANPAGQHEMLELAAATYGISMPPMQIGHTVGNRLAQYYRPGKHEVTHDDWSAILRWIECLFD